MTLLFSNRGSGFRSGFIRARVMHARTIALFFSSFSSYDDFERSIYSATTDYYYFCATTAGAGGVVVAVVFFPRVLGLENPRV